MVGGVWVRVPLRGTLRDSSPRGYQIGFISNSGAAHVCILKFANIPTLPTLLEVNSSAAPMPGNDSETNKVKAVTDLIASQKWSFNDFLIAFYSSGDASIATQRGTCLTKRDGSRFTPEELLDLWLEHSPSRSRPYLKHIIVDRASRIIIKETNKACGLKSLCISATSVEADDLDEDFVLSRLEAEYTGALPQLWYFLTTIITSSNRSEQQKQQVAASKETRAAFVECLLGCSLCV